MRWVSIESDNHAGKLTLRSIVYCSPDNGLMAKMNAVKRSDAYDGMRPFGVEQLKAEVNLHGGQSTVARRRSAPQAAYGFA